MMGAVDEDLHIDEDEMEILTDSDNGSQAGNYKNGK